MQHPQIDAWRDKHEWHRRLFAARDESMAAFGWLLCLAAAIELWVERVRPPPPPRGLIIIYEWPPRDYLLHDVVIGVVALALAVTLAVRRLRATPLRKTRRVLAGALLGLLIARPGLGYWTAAFIWQWEVWWAPWLLAPVLMVVVWLLPLLTVRRTRSGGFARPTPPPEDATQECECAELPGNRAP